MTESPDDPKASKSLPADNQAENVESAESSDSKPAARKKATSTRKKSTTAKRKSASRKSGTRAKSTKKTTTSSASGKQRSTSSPRATTTTTLAPSQEPPGPATTQPGLLRSPTFQALWLSRFLGQMAQGALMYGLLVLLVDRTNSGIYNSFFVICAIFPAVLFGLPAGVAVDALPKRGLLVGLNVLRAVFVLALTLRAPSLTAIFATALAIWMIHQFYAPTEATMLAYIVPTSRLTEAQALSNFALMAAQGIGLVILAPLLLKTSDPRYLFAICAALSVTAALLTALLPAARGVYRRDSDPASKGIAETLLRGARIVTNDTVLFRVTAVDVIVGIGMSGLVVIAPLYLSRILNTPSENTVFVFAPAAIGVLFGLRLAPQLGKHVELRFLATCSMIIFSICVASFGFMQDIYQLANDTLNIPIDSVAATLKIAPLALLIMVFSIPAGMSSSIVGVAARTVTLMRTPAQSRGQVIASQSLAANVGALAPTLMTGIAAELLGVERVAILIALVMLAGAAIVFATRREPRAIVFPAT